MLVNRQINTFLFPGIVPNVSSVKQANLDSVCTRNLQIFANKLSEGNMSVSAGETLSIPVPDDYANTERLTVLLAIVGNVTITIASPDHADSKIYAQGDAEFIQYIQDTVDSISVVENTGTTTANVKFITYVETTTVREFT